MSKTSRSSHARRACALTLLTAPICLLGAAPGHAAGSSGQLAGKFTVHFPKSGQQNNVAECPQDVFCGVGTLSGFGAAEIDVVDDNFEPAGDSGCISFDQQADVRLLDSADDLVLTGPGVICFPGGSGGAPNSPNSQDYGQPSRWTSQLTVDGSQSGGQFHGASGTATLSFTVAGGVGRWTLSGSLTG